MHKQPDLIGSAEAAEILGVDRTTVTRWANAGTLTPFIKGSGRTGEYLFLRSDILASANPAPAAGSAGAFSVDGTAA